MESKPAIWTIKNPEGLYCPDCGCFMKDYYNPLEKCPNCGQRLEGWIDGSDKQKSAWKQWSEEYK